MVPGVSTSLAYSPTASCGRGSVTVVNQATASLYNYTPYLTNEAAAHGGNDCTTWAAWNFYGTFRTLFGDPTPSTSE